MALTKNLVKFLMEGPISTRIRKYPKMSQRPYGSLRASLKDGLFHRQESKLLERVELDPLV